MAVLPYCVILAALKITKPDFGVDEERVETLDLESLRLFYSDFDDSALAPGVFRQSALEFHRVIASIFRQTAVVPFRFPNLLQTREELEAHLRANSHKYKSFLERTCDAVQMEIAPASTASPPGVEIGKSGTEYLREKQQRSGAMTELSQSVLENCKELVLDSRTSDSRVYLLVRRTAIDDFRERLSSLKEIRISGPWPAAEFLEKGS
jgi:Gas vesicle synthesis protein GvpL/GvpF